MQLTLSFLQTSTPAKKPKANLDAGARIGAIKNLARMIAQAFDTSKQRDGANE
jgi:hypothetical protein